MTAALPSLKCAPPPLTGEEIVALNRKLPTARQQKVLDFLATYTADHGYPPTLREIGKHMGIRSTNGVADHLRALERKGFIRRNMLLSRSSVLVDAPTVANGAPAASYSAALDEWKSENEALTTLLRKVLSTSARLPRLTPEFVVLLGDIRDATQGTKGEGK